MKLASSKTKRQAVGRRLRPLVRSLNSKVVAWDLVELEGYTSVYRVYSLPPKSKLGRWLFVCLYADCYVTEIHAGERTVVKRILPQNWIKAHNDEYAIGQIEPDGSCSGPKRSGGTVVVEAVVGQF